MAQTLPKEYGDLVIEPGFVQACETNGNFSAGEDLKITASGFTPSSTVEVRMANQGESYSASIGTPSVDGSGDLDYTFTIPLAFPGPGLAGVGVIGTAPSGADRAAFSFIEVVTSTTVDTDTDTIPDACDNCPDDINVSQLDTDEDLIGLLDRQEPPRSFQAEPAVLPGPRWRNGRTRVSRRPFPRRL